MPASDLHKIRQNSLLIAYIMVLNFYIIIVSEQRFIPFDNRIRGVEILS